MERDPADSIEEPLPTGRRRALLVGINYLRAPHRVSIGGSLKEPIKDVRKMKELLINVFGYSEEHIVVMTDDHDSNEETALWPTMHNIVKQLECLVHLAQPGDSFVFHFAGHSTQKPAKFDKSEIDKLDEALVTWDAQCIVDDILRYILVDKLPDGCKLTAIFDTCHSGTLLDLVRYYDWDEGLHTVHSIPDLGKLFHLASPQEDAHRKRRISLHHHDKHTSAALHEVVAKSHRPVNQSAMHASAVSASASPKRTGLLGSQGQVVMRFAHHRHPTPLVHKHQKPVVVCHSFESQLGSLYPLLHDEPFLLKQCD